MKSFTILSILIFVWTSPVLAEELYSSLDDAFWAAEVDFLNYGMDQESRQEIPPVSQSDPLPTIFSYVPVYPRRYIPRKPVRVSFGLTDPKVTMAETKRILAEALQQAPIITVQTKTAITAATLPATVTQEHQETIQKLTDYHLQLERQQNELENQRRAIQSQERRVFLAVLLTVPFLHDIVNISIQFNIILEPRNIRNHL